MLLCNSTEESEVPMGTDTEYKLTEEQNSAMNQYYSGKLFYGISPKTITKDFLEINEMRKKGETKRADDFEKGLFEILVK
jgi:hypothetical protein